MPRFAIRKAEKVSLRDMARRLDRSPSTLTRELARNAQVNATGYDAMVGQTPRPQSPCDEAGPQQRAVGWGAVREMLARKWSSLEISATLKRTYPDDSCRHVFYETIYNAI